MCGITGYFNLDGEPAEKQVVANMTASIRHRGPDGEGAFVDGAFALGHARLAIFDLSEQGHQPMVSKDGRYTISYNGAIYNFKALRAELEKLGYGFRSESDTEVLLYAYIAWGIKALDRLNGMFAFAIWDRREKELFIARDRYGIKPIYIATKGKTFAFGSEVKAILAHPSFDVRMDLEALIEYFTFQNFFTDRTLFKDVHLLPAGHYIKITRDGPSKAHCYWDYSFEEPEEAHDEGEYLEELDRLFEQAVTRQLLSDVEVGSYLSGGIDSGSITAVAAGQMPYIKTFTCGFDLSSASGMELGFDEREKAERMSYLFKTEHYEMVLKAGDMERILPKLAWHLEEPRVGQSYPNYYASQLASKFVKVVLSGAGGDELFGGYPWRYYRAVVNNDFEDYIDKYYKYWQRLIDNRHVKQAFKPVWPAVDQVWTRNIFRDVFQQHAPKLSRPEDYINHSLYFEAKTFLHGLLIVEDKLSMSHGLETRVPFLDNDLVAFAMRLPARLKLGNLDEVLRIDENVPGSKQEAFYQKTRDGKKLLRNMMARHIPTEITERVKQGFSAPDASWFRGESMDYVKRLLGNDDALIYQYLDRTTIQELVEEHLSGIANRRLLVWSLLNVENLLAGYPFSGVEEEFKVESSL